MQRDSHDIIWGGILGLLGLAVAGYCATRYDLGDLRRMGPGFFPVALGVVLAGLGALIAGSAWRRQPAGERPFAAREALAVIAALLLFGLLMNRAGLVATTAISALTASWVAPHPGLLWRLVLAMIITLLCWAVFILALDMPIPVWPWSR